MRTERPDAPECRGIALYWRRMRRDILWYVLAAFWAAIALAGLLRHRNGNAVLEGAVAVLFIVIGVAIKRRDAAVAARYTANRPR